MGKLGVGVGLTILVLAVAAAAALWANSTSASNQEGMSGLESPVQGLTQTSEGEGKGGAAETEESATGEDEGPGVAFLGVMLKMEIENDVDGNVTSNRVVVVDIVDDGPSVGILEEGDAIVAINGINIENARDVVEAVRDSHPGDLMTLTIADKGDVQVTLGEHKAPEAQMFDRFHDAFVLPQPHIPRMPEALRDLIAQVGTMRGNFVCGEVVIEIDDGFKNMRGAVGILSNIDAPNGTFTLTPRDDSGPIDYRINDETVVITNHTGDLSGLNTEDRTLVVDVDGKVKLVLQGEMLFDEMKHAVPGARPGAGIFQFGHPDAFEYRGGPDPRHSGPQVLPFDLPSDIDPDAQNRIFEVVPFGPDGALRLEKFSGMT